MPFAECLHYNPNLCLTNVPTVPSTRRSDQLRRAYSVSDSA
jgi:hypothetical protein